MVRRRHTYHRAFDGGEDDPKRQEAIERKLLVIKVDVQALYEQLDALDTGLYEFELEAAERLRQWEIIEPVVGRWRDDYSNAQARGFRFSPLARRLFERLLWILETPKRGISGPSLQATVARGGRRERRRVRATVRGVDRSSSLFEKQDRLDERIGPAKLTPDGIRRFENAVATRFMGVVRRRVVSAILEAIRPLVFENADRRAQGKKVTPMERAAHLREARVEVFAEYHPYELAAEYVRAFFPKFGAKTTAELVRKSRSASRSLVKRSESASR